MKLETTETEQGTYSDIIAITKRWYTEQRGRSLGNTIAWDDLDEDKKDHLWGEVDQLLTCMKSFAKPELTPVETRNNAGK